MGVRIPQLRATVAPYRAFYVAAFTDLIPHLLALAQEEIALTA